MPNRIEADSVSPIQQWRGMVAIAGLTPASSLSVVVPEHAWSPSSPEGQGHLLQFAQRHLHDAGHGRPGPAGGKRSLPQLWLDRQPSSSFQLPYRRQTQSRSARVLLAGIFFGLGQLAVGRYVNLCARRTSVSSNRRLKSRRSPGSRRRSLGQPLEHLHTTPTPASSARAVQQMVSYRVASTHLSDPHELCSCGEADGELPRCLHTFLRPPRALLVR